MYALLAGDAGLTGASERASAGLRERRGGTGFRLARAAAEQTGLPVQGSGAAQRARR